MVAVRTMSDADGFSQAPGSSMAGDRPGSPSRLLRLDAVPGSEPQRVNDMLLLRPSLAHRERSREGTAEDDRRHVVFFPGDIQNFEQEMGMNSECATWQCWSYERVALLLSGRFPQHNVWVVRAAHMHLRRLSSYCNFVESSLVGVPEHSANYGAVRHLKALLRNGLQQVGMLPPEISFPPPGFSLTLVGFSKGCVVLNQMVHELEVVQADPELAPFLQRLTAMYWLDGGHSGSGGTWVTDRQALKALAASGIQVHVHVTPYQVRDPLRTWLRDEHRCFVQTLEELGAQITSVQHFKDEPACIDNHFRVIQDF